MKVWVLFTVDPDGDQLVSLHQTVEGAQRSAGGDVEWLKGRGLRWHPERSGGYYADTEGAGMLYTLQEKEVGE